MQNIVLVIGVVLIFAAGYYVMCSCDEALHSYRNRNATIYHEKMRVGMEFDELDEPFTQYFRQQTQSFENLSMIRRYGPVDMLVDMMKDNEFDIVVSLSKTKRHHPGIVHSVIKLPQSQAHIVLYYPRNGYDENKRKIIKHLLKPIK